MSPSKYVYGVVPASAPSPSGAGVAGAPVHAIVADQTAAIVSDVPDGELHADRDSLLAHSRVLERVLEAGVVLPMRFGVVLADEQAVRDELLDRYGPDLAAQLQELDGKVELHLRAIYEESALMSEIVRDDPQIAALRDALQGRPEDATYYERIQLGEMVAEGVKLRREADTDSILAALTPLALAVDVGEPTHERMAMRAAFLVERARMDEFDAAVNELGRVGDGRIRFKYTGPLPPHSFVELALQG